MRLLNTIAMLLVASAVGVAQASDARIDQPRVMPAPASMTMQNGQLRLGPGFRVAMVGHSDERLNAAVARMAKRMTHQTGIELPPQFSADPKTATLVIECKGAGRALPALGDDESYTLAVTPTNAALTANTPVGVLRGLETFLQLIDSDYRGFYLSAVKIDDKPRFPWRGLHIDVARHFQPVDVIKRNLDAMAVVKLNVFHWHLTDDQGFRVESKKFPKLHEMGSDGLFYTQDQIREVVQYAADRGIRVVPEFDMPAHTTAWFVGMPELASLPRQYAIERNFGVFDPVMDPTREEPYRFLREFLREMTTLFPDAYLHVGGDENTGKDWKNNPKIAEYMAKNNIANTAALQTHFNQQLSQIVEKLNRNMVGWDEILAPGLPKAAVVQSWRGSDALALAAKQGYGAILSSPYYLDNLKGSAAYYLSDPLDSGKDLTAEATARILGGETCMWAEAISPETVENRIWPRAAAIAERFWSPRETRDVEDMYRRLALVDAQLEEAGVRHKANSDRMLRRLAGNDDIAALKKFADVVQLYSLGARDSLKQDSQQTPLTRFGDSINAEGASRREVPRKIVRALLDPAAADDLRATFRSWQRLSDELRPVVAGSPQLRENEVRVNELNELATIGLESINYLASGEAPPKDWLASRIKATDRAAKGKTLVYFPWLDSMRLLIAAADEAPRMKNATPEDWTMRLGSLSTQYTIHEYWHW